MGNLGVCIRRVLVFLGLEYERKDRFLRGTEQLFKGFGGGVGDKHGDGLRYWSIMGWV